MCVVVCVCGGGSGVLVRAVLLARATARLARRPFAVWVQQCSQSLRADTTDHATAFPLVCVRALLRHALFVKASFSLRILRWSALCRYCAAPVVGHVQRDSVSDRGDVHSHTDVRGALTLFGCRIARSPGPRAAWRRARAVHLLPNAPYFRLRLVILIVS